VSSEAQKEKAVHMDGLKNLLQIAK